MTTALDLIHATSRHLLAGAREPLNRLNVAVNTTTTTFSFDRDTADITAGAYLSVGLEVVYVWDVNHQTKTATVERAQIGSSAAAHAEGAIVTVNARFPHYVIFEALNQEIRDLSASGLWQMKSKSLTSSSTSYIYDLAANDVIDVYDVRYDTPGPENTYPRFGFEWRYGIPTAEIPNGPALWLTGPLEGGRTLRVWYKARLGQLTALTDDVETVTGIPVTAVDIPPIGAAARLLGVRESKRVQIEAQPETRRSDEVPSGATSRAGQNLLAWREERLGDERTRLSAQWPTLRRAGR